MVRGGEEPSLSLHSELGAALPRLHPRTPDVHVTRPPPRGCACSPASPSVAEPAAVAPLWPGSDLLPSPSSLAGLAYRGGSFISL